MISIDNLTIDELEDLRDACNRRILEMRRTKGLSMPDLLRLLEEVKAALGDQGKEWHSLERWQWMDGEIRFWLNPKEHDIYRSGWFTIDDLIAWTRENGPIVMDDDEDDGTELLQERSGVPITWVPGGQSDTAWPQNETVIQRF